MNSQIVIQIDQSNAWRGLYFERDGKQEIIEAALREGFTVTANDAPAVLTLIENFVRTREECAR